MANKKDDHYWYARNPAKFRRKTSHLSLMEVGAYDRLLDWYYENKSPLPVSDANAGANAPSNAVLLHRLCTAVSAEEQAAVAKVVNEFFTLQADGWHNKMADEELERMAEISQKRRDAQLIREQNRLQNTIKKGANAPSNEGANEGANAPSNALTTTTTIIDISSDISITPHSPPLETLKDETNAKPKRDRGSKLAVWLAANGHGDGSMPIDWIEWAEGKHGWDDDTIQHIAERFYRYFTGPDARNPVKKDWKRAFQNWCDGNLREAQAFISARVGSYGGQKQSYSGTIASSTKQAIGLIEAGHGSAPDDVPDFDNPVSFGRAEGVA